METDRTLGVLAGGGPLPGYLAAACRDAGRDVFIVAFKGHADARVVGDTPHVWVGLGAAKTALAALHGAGVKDIVLAGPVRRPSIVELRPDVRAAEFLARGILAKGDDGLLHALLRELETREGFRVIGADSLLKPLLAPEGLMGRHEPDETAVTDIVRGIEVARALASREKKPRRSVVFVAVTGEEYVLLNLLEVLLSVRLGTESMRMTFLRARDAGALDGIPGLVYALGGRDGVAEELVDTGRSEEHTSELQSH